MVSPSPEPRAAQHEKIHVTVVVVVSLNDVQPANLPDQTRFFGAIRERAVSVVVEVSQLPAYAGVRNDQIQISVPIEVVHDRAPSQAVDVQSRVAGEVVEPADVIIGLERLRRDQE